MTPLPVMPPPKPPHRHNRMTVRRPAQIKTPQSCHVAAWKMPRNRMTMGMWRLWRIKSRYRGAGVIFEVDTTTVLQRLWEDEPARVCMPRKVKGSK